MSMPKKYTEWIRLVAPPEDKQLLVKLTEQRNNEGFSETVRQLIREEAARRNITVSEQPHSQVAA